MQSTSEHRVPQGSGSGRMACVLFPVTPKHRFDTSVMNGQTAIWQIALRRGRIACAPTHCAVEINCGWWMAFMFVIWFLLDGFRIAI